MEVRQYCLLQCTVQSEVGLRLTDLTLGLTGTVFSTAHTVWKLIICRDESFRVTRRLYEDYKNEGRLKSGE